MLEQRRVDALTVVLACWTIDYLPEDQRAALLDRLTEHGATRPVVLLALDGPGLVPGVPPPPTDLGLEGMALLISLTLFADYRADFIVGAVGTDGGTLQAPAAAWPRFQQSPRR